MKYIFQTLFKGTNNYMWFKKHNIPMHFFKEWLFEKWKADLIILLKIILISPLLSVLIFGWILETIGYVIMSIKDKLPQSLFVSNSIRDKEHDVVKKVNKFHRENK